MKRDNAIWEVPSHRRVCTKYSQLSARHKGSIGALEWPPTSFVLLHCTTLHRYSSKFYWSLKQCYLPCVELLIWVRPFTKTHSSLPSSDPHNTLLQVSNVKIREGKIVCSRLQSNNLSHYNLSYPQNQDCCQHEMRKKKRLLGVNPTSSKYQIAVASWSKSTNVALRPWFIYQDLSSNTLVIPASSG